MPEEQLRKVFSANLIYLMSRSGESMAHVSKATGISKGAIGNYVSGLRYPRPAQMELLAKHFGVSVAMLTDNSGPYDGVSLSQRAILVGRQYDQLDESGRQLVEAVLKNQLDRLRQVGDTL